MNTCLPIKYWIENNELHRGYLDNEKYVYNSPRDWDNLGTMVCGHRRYILGDIQIRDMNEWEANKPNKKDTLVILSLSLYDHSGITMYVGGKTDPWDSYEVGYIYVRKDNKEVLDYKQGHTWKETTEWAERILRSEVRTYDAYLRGDVYCVCHERYDADTEEWELIDSYGDTYINAETWNEEQENAVSCIREFSGKAEFIDNKAAENAIENNEIDVLCGQLVFNFMEA